MASALFPGTFDPFTLGHEEMVRRGLRVFDTIVIGIGLNSQKAAMFSEADRKAMIAAVFAGEPRVRIETFSGLTIEFAKSLGVQAMLRGLRNGIDLEYEKPIAAINAGLSPQTETVFLIPSGQTAHISSTLVREVIRYGGPLDTLLPAAVIAAIRK